MDVIFNTVGDVREETMERDMQDYKDERPE